MPDTAGSDLEKPRFWEPSKFLPVAFIIANIAVLWITYMSFHCLPMIASSATQKEGLVQTIVFNVFAFMLVICYVRCIMVHPGTVPGKDESGDLSWEYSAAGSGGLMNSLGLGVQETKRSGDRRHCKWCAKYKPDRCHHCRVCRQCILKMDHHCPWIYNCVGFANHKHFFLLLLYSSICTNIIIWTMLDTVQTSIDSKTSFWTMFILIFAETLAAFLALIVTAFFLFHCWLMVRAMSTIEFCEKSMKRTGYDTSCYNRGFYGNICAVLGDIPLLWMLPVSPPSGDGMHYMTEQTPMRRMKDMEGGRGMRRLKPKKSKRYGGAAGTGEFPASEASVTGPGSALSSTSELKSEYNLAKHDEAGWHTFV